MPAYEFSARSNGELVNGVRQAADATTVAAELNAAGMLPIKIELQALEEGSVKLVWRRRVTLPELIVFSYQMASLTRAGITVVKAIQTLGESSRNEYFAQILLNITADLEGGMDLASCLDRHPTVFKELYVSTIHIGENTGRMDEAFKQIAQYLEMERETKRRIQAATRYPTFVLGAMAIAVVILNIFVIPAFAAVFAKYGADLPWQTQAIIGVSNVFAEYWPIGMVLGVLASYATYRYVNTPAGKLRWHTAMLKIPITGSIFERIYLARFCRTFAMVSRAGVPLVQALRIVSRSIGNEYIGSRVDGMRAGIERGESISTTAQQTGVFSPVVLQMISVGEETGSIDDLLVQAAGFYEEEVDYELKGLTDALEPILIIGIAVLVLIMALGVFLPLWDLNSVAR